MYPNNNNKRIKTKKKEVKTREGEREERGFFFLFLSSLLFKIYGNRIVGFRRRKTKSVHVSRATCGHQNLSVSSNSKKYRIFLLVLFLS